MFASSRKPPSAQSPYDVKVPAGTLLKKASLKEDPFSRIAEAERLKVRQANNSHVHWQGLP